MKEHIAYKTIRKEVKTEAGFYKRQQRIKEKMEAAAKKKKSK